MYIIIALLLLGILVTVHEAGHFFAARITGIPVSEFAIGMGPKLLGWHSKKHDTKFSLRLIPVGGYCAFVGEDDADGSHVNQESAFNNQPVWKRLLTVFSGPLMNFVLAFVVLVLFFWIGGISEVTGIDHFIEVSAAGPAYSAGLQDGDVIASVNGVNTLDGTTDTLVNAIGIYQAGDEPLHLTVLRGEETFETDLTPFWDEEEGRYRIGITIRGYYRTATRACGLGEAIASSWDTCVYASGAIVNSLKGLITTGEGLDQISGPVGIVSMVSDQVEAGGLTAFINYLVLISINLGIMNLLPVPGLDGSRLVFLIIEAIRRKPIPPQKEAMVHFIGMGALMLLMVVLVVSDVTRLLQ